MSSPSNLYAEKIYAEQPISLWSIDDDCTFVSLLDKANLDLAAWTPTVAIDLADDVDPFARITQSSFVKVVVGASGSVEIQSPQTFSVSENFSAGLWVNPQNEITSIVFTIGTVTKTFDMTGITDRWVYLGNVFETSSVSNKYFKIKINGGSASSDVFMNGFSIGINQNFFGTSYTGMNLVALPSALSIYGYGVEAYQYGMGEYSGWYIGDNTSKKVYSKNSSLPLVYGSSSSTVLYPNPNGPSLILPGMGFLNESGKQQRLTFEAWLRIKTDGVKQSNPFRILGPLGSSDGLYVNGQHLILKIGNQFTSHYVGEWFRPMLVNIEYVPNMVRLLVNGEVVCSLEIDNISLPAYSNDYIGFYAGENVDFVEIDCVAVYPYRITPIVAKRRFGYGQAVDLPNEIETAYSGVQLLMDYTFAKYSADIVYPKLGSWKTTTKDAAYSNKDILGSPTFTKPDIVFSNKTLEDTWADDLAAYNLDQNPATPFIKINLPGDYSSASGYLVFKNLRQPTVKTVSAFYLVCDHATLSDTVDEVIFRLQDPNTLNSISAIRSGNSVKYYYNVYGTQGTLGSAITITANTKFVVGLEKNMTNVPTNVKTFLGGFERYRLFVGGDYSGNDSQITTTFSGKIYKVAFCSPNNFINQSMSSLFSGGRAIASSASSFMAKKSTYEYKMSKTIFNSDKLYKLTTSSVSYWQDYINLGVLSVNSVNKDGSTTYAADMMQFSIDAEQSTIISSSKIDSSLVNVRPYMFFKYTSELTNLPLFGAIPGISTEQVNYTKVIDASSSWSNKKFELVDGAVVYLPQSNLASGKKQKDLDMILVLEIYSDDTDALPIKIRSVSCSSQTFNRGTSATFEKKYAKAIGTRKAYDVYMFSQSNGTYDYSAKNPVAISKGMTPYLYATNKSGIKVLDSYSTNTDRGIYIPVNKDSVSEYYISMFTFYALFNDPEFPSEMNMFELYDDRYGKLKVVATKFGNNTDMAYLSLKKADDTVLTNVEFYINGRYSSNPVVFRNEWASVGILFTSSPLDMSSRPDFKIEVVGSFLINNISYFQLRAEELAQQILPNEWNDYDVEITWDWNSASGIQNITKLWSEVAASQGFSRPSLDPGNIANIYSGTNKILAIAGNDDSGIGFGNYTYDVIEDVVWQKTTSTSP